MKIKFLIIGITLVLLVVGLSGCVNPYETKGVWVLHTIDFRGIEQKVQDVEVDIMGKDVTIIEIDPPYTVLFEGKLKIGSPYTIESISVPPYDNPLTISKIYIISIDYMESDLPLIESLNPYKFTKKI